MAEMSLSLQHTHVPSKCRAVATPCWFTRRTGSARMARSDEVEEADAESDGAECVPESSSAGIVCRIPTFRKQKQNMNQLVGM